MRVADLTKRILGLAQTISRWAEALAELDPARRERVAKYAENVADTLARTTTALGTLKKDPKNQKARLQALKELGRMAGYVETFVDVLEHRLDGRKLAGVKRRLETIQASLPKRAGPVSAIETHIDRLASAEGYFRALADGLRV